ncbi:MAG: IS3 family transposase [Vicinamibacterales bacterium]|nr:IS3 family transposase [Vicinamibacterales bacterium]
MEQERATFGVTRLCRCYGVTRAGFYAWRRRPESRHQAQDRALSTAIAAIFAASRGTYGSPRVHQALRHAGHRVSRRRVERLMRYAGLRGRVARLYRRKAGTARWFGQHPNHVRWTRATGPNQIWIGDLTYLRVGTRWWYMATVLDQYSRRVLAWRLGTIRDARLTGAVIRAALRRRRPALGLVFHSDRDSEFLGAAVRHGLAAHGVRQSMTRGGAPGENPHIESFFHSCKADAIHGRDFRSIDELRRTLRWYLPFYNHRRLHSALGYQSPVDYERRAA